MRAQGFLRRRAAAALTLLLLLLWPTPGLRAQGALSAIQTDVDVIARKSRPSVVTVVARSEAGARTRATTRVGSGIAVSQDEVLTSASVVGDARRVWVRTANNLRLEAILVGSDPVSNLALLRVPGVRLPVLTAAIARPVRVGDWVIAVGTSRDNPDHITHSLGSVVYRHRDPRLPLMQLTNLVYPGFSGAAVVDVRGDLVGLLQGERDSDTPAGTPQGQPPSTGQSFMLPWEGL